MAEHAGAGTDLDALTTRLDALEHVPVAEHPAVLEEVHRALVAELDALAEGARATRPSRASRPASH